MSEQDDDLELQALQRRLDDAFETTRPRVGFEDELWLRMQARRPVASRIAGAFAGLFQGIREVPAVPAAAAAALLVVVIGVSILGLSGLVGGHSSAATASLGGADLTAPQAGVAKGTGAFGLVPSPSLAQSAGPLVPAVSSPVAGSSAQTSLTWTGHATLTITTAPVFRYSEPSTGAADKFAAGLGAVLQGRPDGFLGTYEATDYTLRVRGTVRSPAIAPAYFILSAPSMPAISAAGAAPGDIAGLFLAEHGLTPSWQYTVAVDGTDSNVKVHFLRQFVAPGYGLATLVDQSGAPSGLEVDLNGTQPVLASGPLPVALDSAPYPIISTEQAIRLALASSPSPPAGASPTQPVALTEVALVYVLVPAGDHSFYEPAYLFSGTYQAGGTTQVKRVLVPAVDPTQRN